MIYYRFVHSSFIGLLNYVCLQTWALTFCFVIRYLCDETNKLQLESHNLSLSLQNESSISAKEATWFQGFGSNKFVKFIGH